MMLLLGNSLNSYLLAASQGLGTHCAKHCIYVGKYSADRHKTCRIWEGRGKDTGIASGVMCLGTEVQDDRQKWRSMQSRSWAL